MSDKTKGWIGCASVAFAVLVLNPSWPETGAILLAYTVGAFNARWWFPR